MEYFMLYKFKCNIRLRNMKANKVLIRASEINITIIINGSVFSAKKRVMVMIQVYIVIAVHLTVTMTSQCNVPHSDTVSLIQYLHY